jgi:hypothetical protein
VEFLEPLAAQDHQTQRLVSLRLDQAEVVEDLLLLVLVAQVARAGFQQAVVEEEVPLKAERHQAQVAQGLPGLPS